MTDKLDTLVARRSISLVQASAGRMWRGDYLAQATMLKGRTYDDRGPKVRHNDGLDMGAFARRRYRQACDKMGEGLAKVAYRIVVQEMDASDVAEQLGERADAVMPMLRLALDTLARYYEVKEVA